MKVSACFIFFKGAKKSIAASLAPPWRCPLNVPIAEVIPNYLYILDNLSRNHLGC